jgi:hypothetical protein
LPKDLSLSADLKKIAYTLKLPIGGPKEIKPEAI